MVFLRVSLCLFVCVSVCVCVCVCVERGDRGRSTGVKRGKSLPHPPQKTCLKSLRETSKTNTCAGSHRLVQKVRQTSVVGALSRRGGSMNLKDKYKNV